MKKCVKKRRKCVRESEREKSLEFGGVGWGLGCRRENLKDEGQRRGRLRNLQGQKGRRCAWEFLGLRTLRVTQFRGYLGHGVYFYTVPILPPSQKGRRCVFKFYNSFEISWPMAHGPSIPMDLLDRVPPVKSLRPWWYFSGENLGRIIYY